MREMNDETLMMLQAHHGYDRMGDLQSLKIENICCGIARPDKTYFSDLTRARISKYYAGRPILRQQLPVQRFRDIIWEYGCS